MRANWLPLVLSMAFSSSPGVAAQDAERATVLPGDRWVYEVKDEISGDLKGTTTVVVISVSDKEINTQVAARGAERPRQVVFDPNWSRVDDEVWSYRPSDGTGVQIPLHVGKKWRFESRATQFSNGSALRTTGQSKVVGEEKVTTSAGTFDTFKLETVLRHVNSNDQTKAAIMNATGWYAPAINRWVRRTSKTE